VLHKLTHAMTCKEATQLVSKMQDQPLSFGERVKLRLHLLVCAACSHFERQMQMLHAAMRKYRE
jgi:hypothetical protein